MMPSIGYFLKWNAIFISSLCHTNCKYPSFFGCIATQNLKIFLLWLLRSSSKTLPTWWKTILPNCLYSKGNVIKVHQIGIFNPTKISRLNIGIDFWYIVVLHNILCRVNICKFFIPLGIVEFKCIILLSISIIKVIVLIFTNAFNSTIQLAMWCMTILELTMWAITMCWVWYLIS